MDHGSSDGDAGVVNESALDHNTSGRGKRIWWWSQKETTLDSVVRCKFDARVLRLIDKVGGGALESTGGSRPNTTADGAPAEIGRIRRIVDE